MEASEKLRQSDHLYGFWSVTAHPAILDTAAAVGPDFVCIDTQHGIPLGSLDASVFTVLAHYGVPSLVRVEMNDEAHIGRALDLGADGVIIPMVASAEHAKRAVAACRYAPDGTRSFGVQARRLSPFDSAPVCWIQVETADAMGQLEEIASTDGVDGLYVGPADLGLALVGEPAGDVESVFDGTNPH
ncbi:MAG: aldolase/citrate lyase family protein, partial [Halobacteriales archaeon]|nr:aldolase/citrate lyase family protein [Halobacteriales archaeon]